MLLQRLYCPFDVEKSTLKGEYNYISQRIQIHKTRMMVQDKRANEIQLPRVPKVVVNSCSVV